jgi:hypothetical protein
MEVGDLTGSGRKLSSEIGETMKHVLSVLVLGFPVWAYAAAPNAQDYSVRVHVSRSWVATTCSGNQCSHLLYLGVLIDGKKYELQDERERAEVLRPGDYQARQLGNTVRKKTSADAPYDDLRIYEFLFPDGKTRQYKLVGEEE